MRIKLRVRGIAQVRGEGMRIVLDGGSVKDAITHFYSEVRLLGGHPANVCFEYAIRARDGWRRNEDGMRVDG